MNPAAKDGSNGASPTLRGYHRNPASCKDSPKQSADPQAGGGQAHGLPPARAGALGDWGAHQAGIRVSQARGNGAEVVLHFLLDFADAESGAEHEGVSPGPIEQAIALGQVLAQDWLWLSHQEEGEEELRDHTSLGR